MAPKLTPEEKKALKAAKKEEKKRQQLEKSKQVKRDYLGRETKYGELTLKRHEKDWRKMLINLSLPKMREDLEFAWHNFERVVDCKNFTVSLLMDEIKEAEDNYILNVKNNSENIEKLIELFKERIVELQADYENEIVKLKEKGEEDCKQLELSAEEECNYINTIQYILEVAMKEVKRNISTDYFSKQAAIQKKDANDLKILKGTLENRFQYLQKDTMTFFENYSTRVKQIKKAYDDLNSQDDTLQNILVMHLEKIRKTCECLKLLKVKLNDLQKVQGRKLGDAQDEHDFFLNTFNILKTQLELHRKTDMQQLIHLTVYSRDVTDFLESLRKKVEKILQISALCRKLETEKEKVEPFPVNGLSDTDYDQDDLDEYIPCMDLFWQKFAQADGSRYALMEERDFLKIENEILTRRIYNYCQCVTCPVPEKDNIRKAVKHITEGALEKGKYEKQNVPQFTCTRVHFDIDE